MLFFEDVFLSWAPNADGLVGWWALGVWVALGHACAATFGVASWRGKAGWIALALVVGEVLPDRPLAFLVGRLGGFSDQMWGLFLLLVVSTVALALAVRRPVLHRLSPSLAGLTLAVLSVGYHLVIMQGVDTAHRYAEDRRMVALLDSNGAIQTLCAEGYFRCGTGVPPPFNPAFTKDVVDYTTHGLRPGADGVVSGSRGSPNVSGTYVWVAARTNGAIAWFYKDWTSETEASTLGMVLMLLAAAPFWVPAPFLVEWLHRRAAALRRARALAMHPPAQDTGA